MIRVGVGCGDEDPPGGGGCRAAPDCVYVNKDVKLTSYQGLNMSVDISTCSYISTQNITASVINSR